MRECSVVTILFDYGNWLKPSDLGNVHACISSRKDSQCMYEIRMYHITNCRRDKVIVIDGYPFFFSDVIHHFWTIFCFWQCGFNNDSFWNWIPWKPDLMASLLNLISLLTSCQWDSNGSMSIWNASKFQCLNDSSATAFKWIKLFKLALINQNVAFSAKAGLLHQSNE